MGQSFLGPADQSLASREQVQGVAAPLPLKFKQELAQHSTLLEQVLTHLDKIEAWDSTSGVNQTKTYMGSSKQASRNHPALKVSHANHYL
jgi:hypothetical protein